MTALAVSSSADRLSIADLERALAPRMNRSLIQRYDENEELRHLLQKDGRTYPASALPYWIRLCEAREQSPPLVKPETAGVFLRGIMEQNGADQPVIADRLPANIAISGNGTALAAVLKESSGEAIDLLRRLVVAVERERAEVAEDRWIGAEEAMKLLSCSRRALGRRVRPVMRETWSFLEVQAFMRAKREGRR
jgi:hypothetical protein